MLRSNLLRGGSACAIAYAFISASYAQESLPTIDVGAAQRAPTPSIAIAGGPNDPLAYSKPNTTTATKTNTPIMQTPVDVVVVPQQVLQDLQVVTIDDALQNVSGVYAIPNAGQQSGFLIRGFENYKYYLDGVRVDNFSTQISEETADIQQIEVLKGPASILYGRVQPGGLIELTAKKPLATPYNAVQQQFGSYGFYRTTVDSTGPIASDNSLLYRFNFAYENADSFREFDQNRHLFFSPRIHWAPSQDTEFNFYIRYLNGVGPIDLGTPILLDANGKPFGIAPVGRSRNYNEPGSQLSNYNLRVGFDWTHAFTSDWSLTHRFDANFVHELGNALVAYGPVSACGATCPVQRLINNPDNTIQAYYTSLELKGRFDTFGLSHTVLAGWDFYVDHDYTARSFAFGVPDIDLFSPVHTGLPTGLLSAPDFRYTLERGQNWHGFNLQDQIALPFDLHLLAGLRYDIAHAFSNQIVTLPGLTINSAASSDYSVKPRIGLLWQPIPQLSFFGDYVEGFGLSSLLNSDGTPNTSVVAPQQSRQWEGGVKANINDGRLMATFAWFDITKTNIPTPSPDPALAAQGVQVATGEVRNRGVDLDLSGQVTPEFKVIGSFAYIDSRITRDNNGNVGHRFYGVPRFGGSLWGVYEPQLETLKGLSLGAGFVSRSDFELNNANSFTLAGYTTVNIMARYAFTFEQTKMSLQLNVNNLLDKTYYQTLGGGGNVLPGAPRTILGSIKVEF